MRLYSLSFARKPILLLANQPSNVILSVERRISRSGQRDPSLDAQDDKAHAQDDKGKRVHSLSAAFWPIRVGFLNEYVEAKAQSLLLLRNRRSIYE